MRRCRHLFANGLACVVGTMLTLAACSAPPTNPISQTAPTQTPSPTPRATHTASVAPSPTPSKAYVGGFAQGEKDGIAKANSANRRASDSEIDAFVDGNAQARAAMAKQHGADWEAGWRAGFKSSSKARMEERFSPLRQVASLVKLDAANIKPSLEKAFGKNAKIVHQQDAKDKGIEEWCATTADYTVSVQPYGGKVLSITVDFHKPTPVKGVLKRLGFPDKPPSGSPPAVLRWDRVLPGIDELTADKKPPGSGMTSHIFIAPDKARWEAFSNGPEPQKTPAASANAFDQGYKEGVSDGHSLAEALQGPVSDDDLDQLVDQTVKEHQAQINSKGEDFGRGWVSGVKAGAKERLNQKTQPPSTDIDESE